MGLGHLFAQGSWVQSSILVGVEERGESFAEMMTRLGSISEMMGIASMSDRRVRGFNQKSQNRERNKDYSILILPSCTPLPQNGVVIHALQSKCMCYQLDDHKQVNRHQHLWNICFVMQLRYSSQCSASKMPTNTIKKCTFHDLLAEMTVQPTDLQTGIQSRLNPEQIAQRLTFIISLCNLECCGKRQKGCEFLAAIIMSADFTQNSIAAEQSSSDWSLAPQPLFLPTTSGNTRVNIKQLSDRTKRNKVLRF